MKNFFKNVAVFFLITLAMYSPKGFSQAGACTPAPQVIGQPQRCWDGRVIPPVNAIVGQNPYQGVMGQQGIVIPSGVTVGQPFTTVVNGKKMRCTLSDRAATAVVDGAGAGLLAFGIAKIFSNKDANRIGTGAAVAGAGYGATLGCDPQMVDDEERPTQVASTQATQVVPSVQQPAKVSVKVETVFSGETSGVGACRLISDGSARLKSTPTQTVARGQVLAISEGSGSLPKLDDEDCNAWRRRTASTLLYQG